MSQAQLAGQHLERLLEHHDGKPFVLVVDEFQHARTIKGGSEQEEPGGCGGSGNCWTAGAPPSPNRTPPGAQPDGHGRPDAGLPGAGVKVKHGRVTRGLALYRNIMLEETQSHRWRNHRRPRRLSDMDADPQERWLIPSHSWEWLRDALGRACPCCSWSTSWNSWTARPRWRGWRRCWRGCARRPCWTAARPLVLVLGNLDEAVRGGKEPWPEMDPRRAAPPPPAAGHRRVHQALLELFAWSRWAAWARTTSCSPMGRETVVLLLRWESDALAERLGAGCGIRLTVGGTPCWPTCNRRPPSRCWAPAR